MDKAVMVYVGILLFIAALYLFLRGFQRIDRSYQRLYTEIVQSDEYKVKGRNE
jgi:hypothetical protein